jgi:uncharacterized protein YndB with AHSA1/START domain
MTADSQTGSPSAPGEATVEGEAARLVFRRHLHHPPERVWSAITEPEQLRSWMLTEARIDGRPGGSVDMLTGPDRVHATGRVLEWEPPRVYEYEWNVPPGPRMPNGETAIVRWELTPDPDGTLLVLTHRHLSRATATVFARGMRGFIDRLSAQLDGRPMPDWAPAHPGAGEDRT